MGTSFIVDAGEIAEEIKEVASESISEEDLRQGVEYILKSKVIGKLKEAEKTEIPYGSWRPPKARYEVTLVSGIRPDALYGNLIIEYEKPKTFETRSGFDRAIEQVKQYIRDHAETEARFPRYFGVVLDGYKIGFVRYREAIKGFESKGPFKVNKNTIAKLIEAMIGLRRKALSAEELLKDFGPESSVARASIKMFYGKLLGTTPRTRMLFEDWRRVFSQVCAYNPEKIKGLEEVYGFGKGKADPEKLLFALHTYYALIMKLLAAEVASLYVAPKLWSYLKALEDAYYKGHGKLKEELMELEEGGIFSKLGITNFLEADYFAWYLDEWDEEVAKYVMTIINRLSDYDPSAAELEPERVKDLFKRLYQNLVPKKIRHDLGEYYTPDWLAELVLNEVGWTLETFEKRVEEQNNTLAPLELRLLDPACGSGTFLVLAIGRLREYIEEHWIDKGTALRKITKNIVGFDLNPLAVIASRANYLIALGDLLREKGGETVEIPIYLADSILVEKREPTLLGAAYVLRTVAGEFTIPTSIIEKGQLSTVLSILEECVGGTYTQNEFKARLLRESNIEEDEVSILIELFEALSKLEREGKNRIWIRVLKNSFAPLFAGKFDYIVGNPPWVNWESLPEEYRKSTRSLWGDYGLIKQFKGLGLGKVKRDIAMLFVTVSIDRYFRNNAKLGLLVPFTLYKTQAGAGFRIFLANRTEIVKIHDLVELAPFEGAINRTSLLILTRGKTSFPIPCITWTKHREAIDFNLTLEETVKLTKRFDMVLEPLEGKNKPQSPWLIIGRGACNAVYKAVGSSQYRAYAGVYTALNSAYWIEVISRQPNGLLIRNLAKIGKEKVKEVTATVESKFIYPLIRGRDLKKWFAKPSIYILLPVNERGVTIVTPQLRIKHPRCYGYFDELFQNLVERSAQPYKSKLKPYKERSRHVAEKIAPPFYWLFNVTPSLSPYKVMWKYVAGKIAGKGVLEVAVVSPCKDEWLGEKCVIPNEKLMFIPFINEEEAHYVAAVLNSSIARLIVAGYTIETAISTHVTKNVRIPPFDPKKPLHKRLANLSRKAHELAAKSAKEKLSKVEEEIDELVSQLYGLTSEELREIKKGLAILEGGEIEEEVEEAIEFPPSTPDISLRDNVAEAEKSFDVIVVLSNPLDEPLKNVFVKLELFDGRLIEKNFVEVKDEILFPLSFEGLKAGEYKVRATFEYVVGNIPKRVEKELTIYVKGFEVKHVERSFKTEDLLGV